jgi:cytochrome c oxidase subunit 3
MVLAVDAGHQMKKRGCVYMFLTIIGGGIFVGSQVGNGKISLKVSMGLLRQKEVVYFSLLIRKVIVSL